MQHPFQKLSPAAMGAHAWGWLAAPLCVGTGMVLLDLPLRNPTCPNGIVSFELAYSDAAARAIVASWDSTTQLIAALGLGFDYLFLACYTTAIGAAGIALSRTWPFGARVAGPLAWLAWVAGGMDAIENAALAQILIGDPATHWAPLAGACASVKFGILALTLSFLVVALVRRFRAQSTPSGVS